MSAAFTPGPWRVARAHLGGEALKHVVDMGAPPKAPFAVIHSDGPAGEVEANAALIAAAPDLYEALDTTHKLISEFALSGFTSVDVGERLFTNQGRIHDALLKARIGSAKPEQGEG